MTKSGKIFKINDKVYKKIDDLGEGGFAKVYKVTHLDKDYALKIISKTKNGDARWWADRERFVRKEIKIHKSLDNPIFVKLHDDFEDEKAVYLVLELCSKGSLHTYIKEHPLDEKQVYEIFEQIVKGVQLMHNKQLIHRDLTLRNILLTEDMKVKIADFGLSTCLDEIEGKRSKNTFCGTRNYMAPEMSKGKGHNEKVDCWHLGIILYALLAGEIPKKGHPKLEYLKNTSQEARELLDKLLKEKPTERICVDAVTKSNFFKKYEKNSSSRSRDSGNGSRNHLSSAIEKESRLRSLDSDFNSKYSSSKNGKSSSKKYSKEKSSERHIDLQKDKLLPSRSNFFGNDHSHDRKRSASEDRKPYKPLSKNYSHQGYSSRERSVSAEREWNENLKLSCRYGGVNDACRKSCYFKSQERYKSNDSGINSVMETYRSSNLEGTNCVDPPSRKYSNSSHPVFLSNINNPEKLTALNAARLRPKRHMPNGLNTVLHISEDNQVIIEVLKTKKEKKYVSEVFIISTDGMEIKTYKPPKNTHLDYDCPPPFPNDLKEIKSYDLHKLPEMYHKRYLLAKEFVNILRAKKPKLINNGKNGRFYVMENSPDPDMKMIFYDGGSVVKKAQIITITDKHGEPVIIYDVNNKNLDQNFQLMLQEFLNEEEYCKNILDFLESLRPPNFPVIIGEAKNDKVSTRQKIGKENFAPTSKTNRRNRDR